jgi:hypothetical protein
MDIKVDPGTLDAALHEAVLRALGENGRELIIREAVAHLVKEESNTYGSKQPSKLRQAMWQAADDIARSVFKKKLEEDAEFRAQVEKLYEDATKRFFNVEHREKFVEKLAEKMSRAFVDDRY